MKRFQNVFNKDRIEISTAKVQIGSGSKVVQKQIDVFTTVGADGVSRQTLGKRAGKGARTQAGNTGERRTWRSFLLHLLRGR